MFSFEQFFKGSDHSISYFTEAEISAIENMVFIKES